MAMLGFDLTRPPPFLARDRVIYRAFRTPRELMAYLGLVPSDEPLVTGFCPFCSPSKPTTCQPPNLSSFWLSVASLIRSSSRSPIVGNEEA